MNWSRQVPDHDNQEHTPQTVDSSGTLASGSVIYLSKAKIIDGSQVISYGATVASLTVLTETTDYTIDNNTGAITITTAGATAIGTDSVFGSFKYIEIDGRTPSGLSDSSVSRLIDVATTHIDRFCNKTFQAFTQEVQELQQGKGADNRLYRVLKLPVKFVNTILDGALTNVATSVTLDSTTGLTAGDYLLIDTEVMTIDSVDNGTNLTVTRAALGSTAVAHDDNVDVVNFVTEVSTTPFGSTPVYNILSYSKDFSVDKNTGMITLLHNDITAEGLFIGQYPEKGVPDRMRLTYTYGDSASPISVPEDITQAAITIVTRLLVSSAISRGLSQGIDGYNPASNEILTDDIKMILNQYKLLLGDGF